MKYLVIGSEGPGFSSPEEAVEVLEKIVLPSFDALTKLEADKTVLAGGLPVGERALVFVAEAASNEELDKLLRGLPLWAAMNWEVTPLQTFTGRAAQERGFLKELKGQRRK